MHAALKNGKKWCDAQAQAILKAKPDANIFGLCFPAISATGIFTALKFQQECIPEFWNTFFFFVKERKMIKTLLPQAHCGVRNHTLTRRKRIVGGEIAGKVKKTTLPDMSSFSIDLNGHYFPSVKVMEITKSATMLMSCFAAVVALPWM